MAITTGRTAAPTAAPRAEAVEPRRLRPVVAWAVVGAAVLAFEVFVLARWVTGPLFETVPVGPSDPPTFMKIALVVFQATCLPAALFCLYWFVVRPWRRDGRLTRTAPW